jgi:cation diffusion facilitator family transporter
MPLERFAWLSITAALATIALKTAAWWITGSVGLLSDALESLVNLAAALLALWMLRLAAAPADDEHPYGFSKAEYFSAGMEGGLIVFAAAGILFASVPRLLHPQPLEMAMPGLALTVLATLVNFAVARSLMGAGRRFHSITLEADGRHLMTDVWTSAGVFIGIALVFATDLYWLDPLIALAVAAQIVWTGAALVRRSVRGLLDAAISPVDKSEVTRLFGEYGRRYGVSFHALRTRQAGARRFLSFHMLVPDAWTVSQAHKLSEELEERIRSLVPNASIDTHIEPIADPASYEDQGLDR